MTNIIDAAEDAIPGVAQVKGVLSIAKVALPFVAAIGGVGALGGAVLWVHGLKTAATVAEAKAAQQHAVAVVQTGQVAAAAQTAQIVAAGVVQHDLTIHVQQENQNAILAAPGATQAIDPRLNAVGRLGLCKYAAYNDDPECAGLRSADPASGQAAGEGSAPSTP
jgi:hypothetical protein